MSKNKTKCPKCGDEFVNLGAHMVSHDSPNEGVTKIKVIGIGGGGGNITSRMKQKNEGRIKGIDYVAINTDVQDLENTNADEKIQIGEALTEGRGAGMEPSIGRQAAEENKSKIGNAVEGADIAFITCGLGGGTGTGAAPVVAETAKGKDILTIGIVTKPFSFEGDQRMSIAQEGLGKLEDKVDALVVIPNDRVFSVISEDTPINEAFTYIDDVLNHGVQAIADLINMPGIINVDFADIESILKDAGPSVIGVGTGEGEDRSAQAIGGAINSPLLESSIEGAKGALFSIAGGEDLRMSEIEDVAKSIVSNLDSNAQVIFGAYHDKGLEGENIKITVIATGFNGLLQNGGTQSAPGKVPQLFSQSDSSNGTTVEVNQDVDEEGEIIDTVDEESNDKKGEKSDEGEKEYEDDSDSSGPWDIPTFLRKGKDN
ncbi:MAG: cell division protein FtsZ [Candidatus Magasanikbacteria bacterium]